MPSASRPTIVPSCVLAVTIRLHSPSHEPPSRDDGLHGEVDVPGASQQPGAGGGDHDDGGSDEQAAPQSGHEVAGKQAAEDSDGESAADLATGVEHTSGGARPVV